MLIALMLGGTVVYTTADRDRVVEENKRALSVSHEIGGLLLLTQELSQHGLARSEQQWLARYALLMTALAPGTPTSQDAANVLVELRTAGVQLREAFALVQSSLPNSTDPLERDRRNLALAHLQSELSAMNDDASRWYTQASARREALADMVRYAAVAASAGLVLIVLLLVGLFRSRVLSPLLAVRDGAARIEKGQLDAAMPAPHDDEIHDLAQGISRMRDAIVARNSELLALNGVLAGEIDRRIGMERALQNVNDELEERVERRTQDLVRQTSELERKNIELQRFTYIASHDLKTPLRSIAGFIELLRAKHGAQMDDQARDWIDRSLRNTERLRKLIDDLLLYARVESREFAATSVDLDEVVSEVRELLSGELLAAGGQVEVIGALPSVQGDRLALVQLFMNLVGNSLKYRGPAVPHISICCEHRAGQRIFAVTDNGIGIPAAYREAVFEPFKRLHAQHDVPGSGVGLSICRRVVERHGGRIWVEPPESEGTRFCFTLENNGERNA